MAGRVHRSGVDDLDAALTGQRSNLPVRAHAPREAAHRTLGIPKACRQFRASDTSPCLAVDHDRVGLQAYRQVALDWGYPDRQFVATAFHSYIMSDVPLIVPVDLGRMWGDLPDDAPPSIVAKNGLPLKRKEGWKPKKLPHAVVVVGCHRSNPEEFLLNDSATYPFLKATLDDLHLVRHYIDEVPDRMLPKGDQQAMEFISVTPKGVQLPLLSIPVREQYVGGRWPVSELHAGLLRRAQSAHTGWATGLPGAVPRYDVGSYDPGKLRLADFRVEGQELAKRLEFLPPEGAALLAAEVAADRLARKWYWIQYLDRPDVGKQTSSSIWLWNAEEKPSPDGLQFRRYLAGVFSKSVATGQWKVDYISPDSYGEAALPAKSVQAAEPRAGAAGDVDCPAGPSQAPGVSTKPGKRRLKPSLISSFCTAGPSWWRTVPLGPYNPNTYQPPVGRAIAAEVYLMMEPEAKKWAERLTYPRQGYFDLRALKWKHATPSTAVEFLARLNRKEVRLIAERLATNFERHNRDRPDDQKSRIVAIASFVPEITRAVGSREGKLAVAAIGALVQFARDLWELGHEPRIVELVAGSRIQGICAQQVKGAPDINYYACLLDEDTAWSRLLGNLEAAVQYIPRKEKRIALALELEPGLYFLLRDAVTVDRLARKLTESPALRSRVGLNLDVAHWRIAGIDPATVRQNPAVRGRIVHAHISGHHRCAHFGDIPLFELNQPGDFAPWLDLLDDLVGASEGEGSLKFSSFVSVEYEAAKDPGLVRKSVSQFVGLLPSVALLPTGQSR